MITTQMTIEQQVADAFAMQKEFLAAETQRKAIEHFLAEGIPTTQLEAWKYTNLPQALKSANIQVIGTTESIDIKPIVEANRLNNVHLAVVLNGILQPEWSDLPQNIKLISLKLTDASILDQYYNELTDKSEAMTALNTGLSNDGLFLHIDEGVKEEKPLQILHISTVQQGISNTRYLVVAARESNFEVVETRVSGGTNEALNNFVSEIFVAEQAHLIWTTVQQESDVALQINNLYSYQSDESVLDTFTAVLGGKLVRNNLNYLPDGEFCQTHLNGVVITKGSSLADNHTFVNHAQPNCESNESFKHLLADQSTGVFNGKIYVAQDSQKTNAYQSNKTVLLSAESRIFAKPELEIYADDVKCSHGAACGQLDEEAMFYLMARGIHQADAKRLLLSAFATDVLELIHNEMIQDWVKVQIEKRLG